MPHYLPPELHCVTAVPASKKGKMGGEQLWEWALDPHVDACQGQLGVQFCSQRRGQESNGTG